MVIASRCINFRERVWVTTSSCHGYKGKSCISKRYVIEVCNCQKVLALIAGIVGMSERKHAAEILKIRRFSAHPQRNNKSLHNSNYLLALKMK